MGISTIFIVPAGINTELMLYVKGETENPFIVYLQNTTRYLKE